MASINFFLARVDRNGKAVIILCFQEKQKKFKLSTKLKVKAANWHRGELVKGSPGEVKEVNSLLDIYRQAFEEIIREGLFLKKAYNFETIVSKFKQRLNINSRNNEFEQLYELFITNSHSNKSRATIQIYRDTLNKLKAFSQKTGTELSFDNMNGRFYEGLVQYMHNKNALNNTVAKIIKTLKTFLNYCMNQELITHRINLKPFKVQREDVDIIYLTEKEIHRIMALQDLPEYLDHVRANFLFACFTGLRFSDIEKLNLLHIRGEFIEIKANKTKDTLKIPISDYAAGIMAKYYGQFPGRPLPPAISNQKTNEHIKEIAELAGIDEIVEMEKFSGSKRFFVRKPKYELVTTHTARRTFVTLSLEKGIRPEVVMEITGHKKYQTFKRYIKITDTVKLVEMKNMWKQPKLYAI